MPDSILTDHRFDLTVRDIVGMSKVGTDISWLFNPYVDGIEVTQAIQYYHSDQHLTDPSDRQPDNSARLVAYKPAWVRVYLRTVLLHQIPDITGELVIARRTGPFNAIWQTTDSITPVAPGKAIAVNDAAYAPERGTVSATLNFIIPADQMFGYLRLTINLRRGSEATIVSTYTEDIDVTLLQTLRLRGIFISYNGQNAAGTGTLNLTAPTLADLQHTAAYTLTADPVEATGSFASAGSLTWSTPLTGVATTPGGCSTQWIQLNAAVAQVKTNDGNRNDVIYYGLLPNGVPIANVGGCESSGVSTGPNGAQVTMAHEVGHGAGLAHGPCGTTSGDPNYPAYEPYDTVANRRASIGEYGLNINNGFVLSPANNDDYMSYCNQNWISLYHHAKLINVAKFNPRTVGINHWRPPQYIDPWLWPWEIRRPGPVEEWNTRFVIAQPVISIIGIVDTEGKVTVQSVMRLLTVPVVENASQTSFKAALLDANRQLIAEGILMRFTSQGCGRAGSKVGGGCGCNDDHHHDSKGPFVFQSFLPDTQDGYELRITRHEKDKEPTEIWSRKAPDFKPRITGFTVDQKERYGYARWEINTEDRESIEYSMQFSKDEGRSWNGIAVGIKGNEYRFDLSALPSGGLIFALLAHDGFHSTKAISAPVKIARKPPVVSILHPAEGSVFFEEQPLRLWAAVSNDTATPPDQQSCKWFIDGKEIQTGTDGWISAPQAGKHECRFAIESEAGMAEMTIIFITEHSEFV